MAIFQEQTLTKKRESILSTNRVLRNTYLLLGTTLVFSALTAAWSMISNAAIINPILVIIGYFGLLFLTSALKNSPWGLVAVLALTGFLGYTLGPILNFYIKTFTNGSQIIMTSLGATGIIFFGLSAYTVISRKDFSYLGGFIFIGITVAFLLGLLSLFTNMPALQLLISGAFVLLCSGLIMFQTSLIIHGGETNYIMATVTLYVSILNIFLSLLQILGAFGGNRN